MLRNEHDKDTGFRYGQEHPEPYWWSKVWTWLVNMGEPVALLFLLGASVLVGFLISWWAMR